MKNNHTLRAYIPLLSEYKQVLRTMKVTLILLMSCVSVAFGSNLYSQSARVNINISNSEIGQVIQQIEQQTDYLFVYSSSVDVSKKVSVKATNKPTSEVLSDIFANTEVMYSIQGNNILLHHTNKNAQQSPLQNSIPVSGTIVDTQGETIIGANVTVKNSSEGTITDIDGKFKLNAKLNDVLVVSYLGYNTQEIVVKNSSELLITLKEQLKALNEVVVVGYGTQKKTNLTGSVASINTDAIKERVETNILSAVQGTIPGVTIISRPGQTPSINFRGRGNLGTSEPLYVIDGIIADATIFSNLDANSIESMSFLKDAASSAIYGSRAAYGVVLVTTKEGKAGNINVNYNGNVGVKIASYLPKTVSSAEYATMLNEGKYNEKPNLGKNQTFSDEEIGWFRDGSRPDYYPNTDWFDLVLDKEVITTQHSLNFSGGSDRIKYFTGLGYMYDDNHMPGNNTQRYNLNINLSADVTKWLTLKSGVKFIKRTSDRDRGYVGGVHFLTTPPTMVAQQSNGEWGSMAGGKIATQSFLNSNPLRVLNKNDWSKGNNEYSIYDLGFDIKPLKGLVVSGQGSYKRSETKSKSYSGLMSPIKNFETGSEITGTGIDKNSMSMSWGSSSSLLTTLTANYSATIDKHDFTLLAGTSYDDYKYEGLFGSRDYFFTDGLEDLNVGEQTSAKNSGGMNSRKMLSYFGRLNYAFDSRYLFEANMRVDGSSRFHKDNRWGYFPSFSAGWRISEEAFMADQKTWLDNLKVRASWGKLGNINNVNDYEYYMRYGKGSYNYTFDDKAALGIAEYKIANPKLGWEKVTITDFGLDVNMLNGKLNLVADYYIKETTDILLTYNVPLETGISSAPAQNIGKVRNTGLELALNHNNKVGDFSYSIGGNIATNRNRITNMEGSDNMIQNGGDKIRFILKEGEPIGSFYGYKTDGLYSQEEIDAGEYYVFGRKPNAGDIKYVPQREGVKWGESITSDDRTVIGKDVPNFTYGINFNLTWKDFEFSAFGQGVSGTSVAFESEQIWAFFLQSTPREIHTKRWTEENPNSRAPYPRIYGGSSTDNYNQNFSDYQLFDADYFRIKTLSLGYRVPQPVASRLGLSALKFFLVGENLITIRADKDMKDFDPEAASGRGIGSFGSKSVAFGVNVSF